jgi:hypothetical protein
MKALIKAHFTTNENIIIKLHIKVVIHRYCLLEKIKEEEDLV